MLKDQVCMPTSCGVPAWTPKQESLAQPTVHATKQCKTLLYSGALLFMCLQIVRCDCNCFCTQLDFKACLPMCRSCVQQHQAQLVNSQKGNSGSLVLFDDALHHCLRISRCLAMDRGCMLLIGVGGSGKQSLAKLASHIAGLWTVSCCYINLQRKCGSG